MARLSRIKELTQESSGTGFFLCARKEVRQTKMGEPFLSLLLQDATGEIPAKVFGVEAGQYRDQFEAGEFVAVEGRANLYQGRTELILSRIRRVNPAQDRQHGFCEEDCVPSAPRSIDEMWAELQARIASVEDPAIRVLLSRIATDHEDRLRIWPAALTVHHAYRGGLLEHVLQIAGTVDALGRAYGADLDLLFAGAMLHDIGKLRELDYESVATYSREGNLVGHIAIGLMMARDAAEGITGLSEERRLEVEHLIASHHGSRELGSPVEPMTLEAFILAMADDLDAKVHQVQKHIATDESDGEFTSYHVRLKRVLLKPPPQSSAPEP